MACKPPVPLVDAVFTMLSEIDVTTPMTRWVRKSGNLLEKPEQLQSSSLTQSYLIRMTPSPRSS